MSNDKENVNALILSGGGVKGTFQYGAIDYIVSEKKKKFKIVCGVSAGAMNGSIIAQGKFQVGKDMWMEQIQQGVPAFDMRYPRGLVLLYGILPGFFLLNKLKQTESIFINRSLREILTETSRDLVQILEETDTYLRLGIVEYQTGSYLSIDPTSPEYCDKVVDVIIASTAIPLAFPSVGMNKFQYFDGGVINTTPFSDIFEIIRKPEFQQKYNLTSIYSVLCSPLSTHESHQYYRGLVDIAWRTLDILLKEIYLNDKDIFDKINALVWMREEIERVITDPVDLERIYAEIKRKTGIDIRRYCSAHSEEVIAPDPKEWKNFIDSGFYPEDMEKPEIGENDPAKIFWEQWPSTLSRDPKKLRLCYHFGMYMAWKVLN